MAAKTSKLKAAVNYLNFNYLNAPNTAKSSLGFMRSIVMRALPQSLQAEELTSIFNYLPISESITTSGQPNEKQFLAIKNAGFQVVINLAPHYVENALPAERQLVESLGLEYVHIPVDFKQPTEQDFQEFCAAMAAHQGQPIFIHCAANMRVSAFIYRYRTEQLKMATAEAKKDLAKIWQPFGVWAEFIERKN